MNEAFCDNMMGKRVSFDVQPYYCGSGTIQSIKPRRVKVTEFLPDRGRTVMEYECFDVSIAVDEGTSVGALSCGVPMQGTVRDMAGTSLPISGLSYGQVYRAVEKGQTIVQVRCG